MNSHNVIYQEKLEAINQTIQIPNKDLVSKDQCLSRRPTEWGKILLVLRRKTKHYRIVKALKLYLVEKPENQETFTYKMREGKIMKLFLVWILKIRKDYIRTRY